MLNQRAEGPRIQRPPPEPATIFIGHGHSRAWKDLKALLDEQLGYRVEAYETGARAGHTIRDHIESMPSKSSFAILVTTAEDTWQEGTSRTREQVIHDVGLFQGRLGFDRAIVAIENGVEPFSHLQGIHQLQFRRGNIREIYGEVLATLRREFSDG
jgi:predicted nucleotide-binding protein